MSVVAFVSSPGFRYHGRSSSFRRIPLIQTLLAAFTLATATATHAGVALTSYALDESVNSTRGPALPPLPTFPAESALSGIGTPLTVTQTASAAGNVSSAQYAFGGTALSFAAAVEISQQIAPGSDPIFAAHQLIPTDRNVSVVEGTLSFAITQPTPYFLLAQYHALGNIGASASLGLSSPSSGTIFAFDDYSGDTSLPLTTGILLSPEVYTLTYAFSIDDGSTPGMNGPGSAVGSLEFLAGTPVPEPNTLISDLIALAFLSSVLLCRPQPATRPARDSDHNQVPVPCSPR